MQKRILTVSYITERGVTSPFIRLRGRWLSDAGFRSEDKISVLVSDPGRMVIQKETDDNRRALS